MIVNGDPYSRSSIDVITLEWRDSYWCIEVVVLVLAINSIKAKS